VELQSSIAVLIRGFDAGITAGNIEELGAGPTTGQIGQDVNVAVAISFPGPKTCVSRRLYLMSSIYVDLRSGLMSRDASNPRNPSVRLANTKKARPKWHSIEAPNFLVYNTNIRDLFLIEMAVTARFIVKRCATADVRPSSIESRLTTTYAPWCSALGSV